MEYALPVPILGVNLLERRVACHHDEEDDSGRKEVNLKGVILLFAVDLGRLVPVCAHQSHELVLAGRKGREAEVRELEVEVFVKQDVLRFDVAMPDSLEVHVLDGLKQVREQSSGHVS
jgi:hypothetical protein